ncbi:MAG: nucleotidyl transferase AbiEii/AbiGii toxin family protein [Chitinophagales bacterium]|nr:nucleotidyl transferase AbiEii/AbiGii toxin family protein [Romboutsia sp.]
MNILYYNTISEELLAIIKAICVDSYFDNFILFGGTALALQVGHRISIDADFVCEQSFNSDELIYVLQQKFPNSISDIRRNRLGVFLQIDHIKVDFLSWDMLFIRNIVYNDNIRLMHIEEIIASKLFAILNRGEKKDYIDIAILLKQFSLSEMINFYKEKYNNSDETILLKYLCSFSDIDFQPEPKMLINFNWNEAKHLLINSVEKYTNK